MGMKEDFTKGALRLSQKAMERLLADEKRAMRIASAIGSVQKGKEAVDRTQSELIRALNLVPKADFKTVGKQLSSLKRRVRDLGEKIDQLESKAKVD